MPTPHPRRLLGLGGGHVLDGMTEAQDWAPPGWHWEVLPFEAHNLVRDPGSAIDPDLLWWRSHGPWAVRREPTPEEVVHRRIREEDDHVRRSMHVLDSMYPNTWAIMQGSHVSYDHVDVPYLWLSTARGSAPGWHWEVHAWESCSDVLGLNKK
jgi:hypothetical protein